MKTEDRNEIIRLLSLIPKTEEEIIEKTLNSFRGEELKNIAVGNNKASYNAFRLSFLASDLSRFYVLNGILENDIPKILKGCALEGRVMLLSNKFDLDNSESSVYIWNILKSVISGDSKCVSEYFNFFPNPSKYMFEVRGITNSIRDVLNGIESESTSSCREIFIKKSSNKFCESALQLMRTIISRDEAKFNEESIFLLKNYKRWAVANNLLGEVFIPLKALALIRFGIDYRNFKVPDLKVISNYAVTDLTEILTYKFYEEHIFDSQLNGLWKELFEFLDIQNTSIDSRLFLGK
jgi:hypothetical protein